MLCVVNLPCSVVVFYIFPFSATSVLVLVLILGRIVVDFANVLSYLIPNFAVSIFSGLISCGNYCLVKNHGLKEILIPRIVSAWL